jgi:hypothetical protein
LWERRRGRWGGPTDGLANEAKKIFPAGTSENQAIALAAEIEAAAAAGDHVTADARVFALTTLTLTEYRAGKLGVSSSLTGDLSTFLKDAFDAGGLAIPPLRASSFGSEGIAVVVDMSGGTFTTRTFRAGIVVPSGALQRAVLLVADRLPDSAAHPPGDGPLPTNLTQYPLFYEFTFTPPTALGADVILGICLVSDPVSAYYAPDDILGRLQLAHPDPDDAGTLEFLERVGVPFVDCDDVATRAARAHRCWRASRHWRAGADIRPFGAVDPQTEGVVLASETHPLSILAG